MKHGIIITTILILLAFAELQAQSTTASRNYPIVDTDQMNCYDNFGEINCPEKGKPFYGQDARIKGNQPSYTDHGDGTITDNITGLMWQKGYDVLTYDEALVKVKTFNLANHTDWRLPGIKEAYSLMLFSGVDASTREMDKVPERAKPFVNTRYFDFKYGSNGDRVIDTQMLSSTVYKGTTMGGNPTVFGVNLADGRIKGYPIKSPQGTKRFTVRFVRGNTGYGLNNFQENGNGTISDLATNLMWQQEDSRKGMNWEGALAWVEKRNSEKYLGYNDWRLPNAKELHSIVDYSAAPRSNQRPAINPLFKVSEIMDEEGKVNYPFYWSSTTLVDSRGGTQAVYVCFGEALGFMRRPGSPETKLMDVHGAGAQRSDPKIGDPGNYPQGRGPQGDVVRIYNYIRMVRNIN
jgi:hypothetical protein